MLTVRGEPSILVVREVAATWTLPCNSFDTTEEGPPSAMVLSTSLRCLRPPAASQRVARRAATRALSSGNSPLNKLVEKNAKYREASEEALEKSRDVLCARRSPLRSPSERERWLTTRARPCRAGRKEDMADHRSRLLEMRSLLKNEQVTVHAAPQAFYSPKQSFPFPPIEVRARGARRRTSSAQLPRPAPELRAQQRSL
eukprot:6494003-Prymnesium_polylepis.1